MDLRYPIGNFEWPQSVSPAELTRAIEDIEAAPRLLREAVAGLSRPQLDTAYRPGGWTVRQLVHHVADSHMNSYVRFRLAVTEDRPTIKPYDETRWAQLSDARTAPIEVSLTMLEAMHDRWVRLLRSFGPAEWEREFVHPERGPIRLDATALLYAWHGRHHTAHIAELRRREGWA
jgi:hypothetical protein